MADTWLISSSESVLPFRDFRYFDDLIAADVKTPNGLWHGPERLGLVDPDRLFFGRIAHSVDGVVAFAVVFGQASLGKHTQKVRLHQPPAELRQCLKGVSAIRKWYAWKVDAQQFRVTRQIGWRVQDRVDIAEDFFRSVGCSYSESMNMRNSWDRFSADLRLKNRGKP